MWAAATSVKPVAKLKITEPMAAATPASSDMSREPATPFQLTSFLTWPTSMRAQHIRPVLLLTPPSYNTGVLSATCKYLKTHGIQAIAPQLIDEGLNTAELRLVVAHHAFELCKKLDVVTWGTAYEQAKMLCKQTPYFVSSVFAVNPPDDFDTDAADDWGIDVLRLNAGAAGEFSIDFPFKANMKAEKAVTEESAQIFLASNYKAIELISELLATQQDSKRKVVSGDAAE